MVTLENWNTFFSGKYHSLPKGVVLNYQQCPAAALWSHLQVNRLYTSIFQRVLFEPLKNGVFHHPLPSISTFERNIPKISAFRLRRLGNLTKNFPTFPAFALEVSKKAPGIFGTSENPTRSLIGPKEHGEPVESMHDMYILSFYTTCK